MTQIDNSNSPATADRIADTLDQWRRQLLDTSRISKLINCKFSRGAGGSSAGGAMLLEHPGAELLWDALAVRETQVPFAWPSQLLPVDHEQTQDVDAPPTQDADDNAPHKAVRVNLSAEELQGCLASLSLKSDELLTGLFDKRLDTTLQRMNLAAQTSLSEQGINSLFVAFGFLHWFESRDSDEETVSPLLLLPVSLAKEHGQSTWVLKPIDDEIAVNHSLAELFRTEFRIALPSAEDDELRASPKTLANYLQEVRDVVAGQSRWRVESKAALGLFGFQKIAMWHDLLRNEQSIIDHPLCRSIAGDTDALSHDNGDGISTGEPTPDPTAPGEDTLDVSAGAHNLILDSDGSQLAAITAVGKGSNLILDGPPGTGKSQTIANIIAEALANGKTVLFVCEKPAALEVVKRRLDKRNLGDFCLECHSHKSNKRAIIDELGRCLKHNLESYPSIDDKLSELDRCRQTLNHYVRALHQVRSELEESAFQIHGKLAALHDAPLTRADIQQPHQVTKIRLQELELAVARLVRCESIIALGGKHPWRGCRPEKITLSFVDDVQHYFPLAASALEVKRLAAAPLVPLGLLTDNFTAKQLESAREAGKTAVDYPLVTVVWITPGLRQSADSYIKLHDLATKFRITLSGVSDFTAESLGNATLETFALAQKQIEVLRLSLTNPPGTLRDAHRHIDDLRERVAATIAAAETLRAAADSLRALLGISPLDASASQSRAVAQAGRVLTALGKIPGGWFESKERSKLHKALLEAQNARDLAVLARKPLGDRFAPVALASASKGIADELLAHPSWYHRFGGSWRRAKQAFISLYSGVPPMRAKALLDDAHSLNRYRAAEAALAVAAETAKGDTFGWDGSLEFDWAGANARLGQVDSIDPSIAQSSGFQSVATTLDAEAAAALREGVGDVERRLDDFNSAIQLLSADVNLTIVVGESGTEECGLQRLSERLKVFGSQLTELHKSFTTIVTWTKPDGDLNLNQLKSGGDIISALRDLHQQAIAVASNVGESIGKLEQGNLGDFSKQAELAAWVITFLDQFSGQPPHPLVRLLHDVNARETLAQCLKAINDADTPELRRCIQFVTDAFPTDVVISDGLVLDDVSEQERIAWLNDRTHDAPRVEEWSNYLFACDELERCGLSVLRDEVVEGAILPKDALTAFLARFYKRWLDETYRNEPVLREFDPGVHEQTAQRFRELDRFWIHNGFARIRSNLISKCPNPSRLGGVAPGTSEIGVLLRETNKKRRHLPLRKLFAAMPTLLQKLKPCIMMSPLAVSSYFESSDAQFDLVIFDEASQIRQHEAICTIRRGTQLIVAGDQKQLPPTNFFDKLTHDDPESDDETSNTADYESILDICASKGLPRQRLKWHYRSKRESLIAFSNKYFYDNELITFPSVLDVVGSSGVTLNYIAAGQRGKRGSVTNLVEATHIAQAVVRHANERPDKSLGVITMNAQQQLLVIDGISRLRRASASTEAFFALDNPEPFFVKNLENVQGDERDYIFMGIGFAKDQTGRLSHAFGPLNRQGGERRLNVAVTRARESMTVFSSIKAQDIDLARTAADGARLLRAYLDFAERGPVALLADTSESPEADNDSEFEAQVERALRSHGLDVRRQVGCCGFRIDLALVDPARKGRYVLGIEADGATYHSSALARDRDRLRQEQLENLGWRITRIWSTDWIRNPTRQIERVLKDYQSALAAADVAVASTPKHAQVETLEQKQVPASPAQSAPSASPRPYANVDEVPSAEIEQHFWQALESFGSVAVDDLFHHVAMSLGFHRTGNRITARLQRSLDELKRAGIVQIADDRVMLVKSSR